MRCSDLEKVQLKISSGCLEPSCQSCLALLVMALGCVGSLFVNDHADSVEISSTCDKNQERKNMAEACFDGAMKMLYMAHSEMNIEASQCLFLTR